MWTLKWTDDCAWTMVLSFSARTHSGKGNGWAAECPPKGQFVPRVCVDHLHVRQRLVRLTSRHGRCVVRFVTVGSVVDNVAFLIGWVVYKELSALRPYSVKTALLLHSDSPRERES